MFIFLFFSILPKELQLGEVAGFLQLNFIRSTELSATTKLSEEHETPPFG
jgi:hypothetical protein